MDLAAVTLGDLAMVLFGAGGGTLSIKSFTLVRDGIRAYIGKADAERVYLRSMTKAAEHVPRMARVAEAAGLAWLKTNGVEVPDDERPSDEHEVIDLLSQGRSDEARRLVDQWPEDASLHGRMAQVAREFLQIEAERKRRESDRDDAPRKRSWFRSGRHNASA